MKKPICQGQAEGAIHTRGERRLDADGDDRRGGAGNDANGTLVRQLLFARLEGLGPSQVAAFVSGWSNALELTRRTDLILPSASAEVKRAIAQIIDEIEIATAAAMTDPDD